MTISEHTQQTNRQLITELHRQKLDSMESACEMRDDRAVNIITVCRTCAHHKQLFSPGKVVD